MSKSTDKPLSFQDLILTLQRYWSEQGCVILHPDLAALLVRAGLCDFATF